MPPRSPLLPRHGLQAAWVRTPDRDASRPAPWPTLAAFLRERLAPQAAVDDMLAEGRFVHGDGSEVTGDEPYTPHTFVWFHRDLRDEPEHDWDLPVLHRDDRLVVLDKPHFLSSIPRGQHVLQSAVVLLRNRLGLPELGPVHRLDRLTAGVLVFTTEQRWRKPYQQAFEHRLVTKTYEAVAPYRPELEVPRTVCSHIIKQRGKLQVTELPLEPNAETLIEVVEHWDDPLGPLARYRLTPHTGRTHQLRVHLAGLGVAIINDPLYPEVTRLDVDDHSRPLALVARSLAFTDPVDQTSRLFTSRRELVV